MTLSCVILIHWEFFGNTKCYIRLFVHPPTDCGDRMLDELEGPGGRATREFRQKFPDEIVTDNLGGQLWFGAECLAAGSSIMNKVVAAASFSE